jgi:hypothetical protein
MMSGHFPFDLPSCVSSILPSYCHMSLMHIHTLIHSYINTFTCSYIHTLILSHIHTLITFIHSYIHAYTTYTQSHSYMIASVTQSHVRPYLFSSVFIYHCIKPRVSTNKHLTFTFLSSKVSS